MRKCVVCKEYKEEVEFYKCSAKKDGISYRCKICDNLARKKYYQNNQERCRILSRNRHWKHKYNVTPEQYEELLKKQNYRCAICNTENSSYNQGHINHFAIDHDHNTGRIRGLLCHNCNRALGLFKDSALNLEQAYYYLKTH